MGQPRNRPLNLPIRPNQRTMTGEGLKPPTHFHISAQNLDTALRYQRAIALFADLYRPDLSIVEVGSGSAGITEFLEHPVTGVDVDFERTAERRRGLLNQVPGAADHLPLLSASYDVVVSLDMLEHVPPAVRPLCLREMLRVLRPGGRCILAFPADRSGERLDQRLNDAYRQVHGVAHPWIAEHIERGLPKTEEIVSTLKDIGEDSIRVTVRKHLWGPAWWHGVHRFPTVGGRNLPFLWRTPQGAMLLFRIVRHLNFRPAYRSILVIDKLRGTAMD